MIETAQHTRSSLTALLQYRMVTCPPQILESDVALDTVAAGICPTNRPDLLVLALQRRLEEAA